MHRLFSLSIYIFLLPLVAQQSADCLKLDQEEQRLVAELATVKSSITRKREERKNVSKQHRPALEQDIKKYQSRVRFLEHELDLVKQEREACQPKGEK